MTCLIVAQCIILYITILFSYNTGYAVIGKSSNIQESLDTLYKINDSFIDEEESLFFARADCLDVLKAFCDWECNNEYFSYIIMNRQLVYVPANYKLDNTLQYGFKYGMGITDHYASLQVNDTFFQHFNIKCSEGNLFKKEDYSTENTVLPVLLGYSYIEYWSVGDSISLSYLGSNFECKVVGFLEEGSFFNDGKNLESLDKYIILPSLEAKDIYSEDVSFMMKLYLDKCSGFISTALTEQELQMVVTQKCLALDIRPYCIEGVSSFYLSMWGVENNQLKVILLLLSIIIGGCSLVAITLNVMSKIMERRYEYAVICINGIDRLDIHGAVFLETLMINLVAACGALIFTVVTNMYFDYKFVFIIICFLSLVSAIPPCIMIKNMCLADSLKAHY